MPSASDVAVLVRPPGALVFRIVDYTGTWINERADWRMIAKDGKLRNASTNPTRECAKDVYSLRKYFAKRGVANVPVYGIVSTAVIRSIPYQRLASRRFSLGAC